MNINQNFRTKKTAMVVLIVAAVICIATVVAVNISPLHTLFGRYNEKDLAKSLEDNDYARTVKIYNAIIAGNEDKESKYNASVQQEIDELIAAWSAGDVDYDSAAEGFTKLQELDNQNLATEARNELRFIKVETEGNASYAKAEEKFEAAEYYEALVALSEIDPTYSQYYYVKEFKGECETILLALISSPTTEEEYADCEKKVELYLSVDNAECFRERKAELAAQRDDFENAVPFLESAKQDFDMEDYTTAFGELESGLKSFPDNVFLKGTLDEYHNVYVAGIAQKITEDVQKEQYDEALNTIETALDIYDYSAFEDMRVYVKECKSPLYKAKNNIVEKITELKTKLVSGDVDVEQAKKEAGAYVTKSGKKFMLGSYDQEEITLLSASGDIATSLIGIDVAADVRDLSYDVTHWGEEDYFALCLAADVVALVPVIGAVKYLKYSKEAGKGAKKGAKAAMDLVGGTTAAAKKTSAILDKSVEIAKNAEQSAVVTKQVLKHTDEAKAVNVAMNIGKGLEYTSKNEVATYIRKYKELPPNYMKLEEAMALIEKAGIKTNTFNPSQVIPGKQVGGNIFGNREGRLPALSGGRSYVECDVDCPNAVKRGDKRIVFVDDGSAAYYTDNHYTSFTRIF